MLWICSPSPSYDLCDAHVDNVILADVVNGIGPIGVRALVIPQLDRVQDETDHLGKIAHTFRVFSQDGGSPGNRAVKDRHLRP